MGMEQTDNFKDGRGSEQIVRKTRNGWSWVPTLYFAEGLPAALITTVSLVMFSNLCLSERFSDRISQEQVLFWTGLFSPSVDAPSAVGAGKQRLRPEEPLDGRACGAGRDHDILEEAFRGRAQAYLRKDLPGGWHPAAIASAGACAWRGGAEARGSFVIRAPSHGKLPR